MIDSNKAEGAASAARSLGFTPGPWEVAGRYGNIGVEVQAHGHSLAVVNRVQSNALDHANEKRSKAAKNGEPAHQAERLAQRLEETLPRALADATLIAAAPDLYEVVRKLVCHESPPDMLWERARLALMKAQGNAAPAAPSSISDPASNEGKP